MHVARSVCAIQPFEDPVSIAQPGIDEGDRIRRDVPLAGGRLQHPQQIVRLGSASRPPEDVPGERQRLTVLAGQPGGGCQALQGEVMLAQLLERLPTHLVPDPELLIEGDGALGVLQGTGVVAGLEGHLRRQRVRQRVQRVQLARAAHERFRLGVPARLRQQVRQHQVHQRVAGVQPHGPSECGFSSGPVPLERPLHMADGVLRLRDVGVGGDGSNGRLSSGCGDAPGVHVAVDRARAVCHGEVRPRERIGGIGNGRPPEILDGARHGLGCALVQEVTPPKKEVVCVGTLRLTPCKGPLTFGRQTRPDLLGNGGADLLLQAEDAAGIAVEGVGPDLHLVAHTNQPGRDPQMAALRAE